MVSLHNLPCILLQFCSYTCKGKVCACVNCPQKNVKRERERERERIPHTWACSDQNYLKSFFGFVSYCMVVLRMTPYWSVKMTSSNFRLLIWEQQIKITFAAGVQTNDKFQIIIMGHGDSLCCFIFSWRYRCQRSTSTECVLSCIMLSIPTVWLMHHII